MLTEIKVKGARTHNLKNIDVTLPRDQLIVITGLSGSGKSSLAFDTIYAEGQRRYVESLSAYARQFLSTMDKPDIDHIEGLSPAISIEQKSTSHNPRSTVGTVTEIHDYLRLLYARAGTPRCPTHHIDLKAQTVSQMVDRTLELPEGSKCYLLAPVVKNRKGEHLKLLDDLLARGFIRAKIDGVVYMLDEYPALDPKANHTIEVIVDRFKVKDDLKQRLAESFETALRLADGVVCVAPMEDESGFETLVFSSKFACPECGYSLSEMEPRLFSFNNPQGACPACDGLGKTTYFDPNLVVAHPEMSLASGAIRGWDKRHAYYYNQLQALAEHYQFDLNTDWQDLPEKIRKVVLYGSGSTKIALPASRYSTAARPFEGVIPQMERHYQSTDIKAVRDELGHYRVERACESCGGARLNEAARNVFIAEKSLPEINHYPIGQLYAFFETIHLQGNQQDIAEKIIKEIRARLHFLVNVGLSYLSLERSADTLSGGEAQRIRLASQIGAGLVGVMYVLDEPSIGLHQRDNDRLLATLTHLRDIGNTVIVVEHDEDAIRLADHVLDIGPGAGVHGGEIVAQGTPQEIMQNPQSLTGQYLSGNRSIAIPKRTRPGEKWLILCGATGNNLQNVTAAFPVGLMTCVTGVSGSGKSTLVNDTLNAIASAKLNKAATHPAPYTSIDGLDHLDKVVTIDQSPIGRTPRSNPATYTGLFSPIRELLASSPEARARGYQPGRFSFNVKGGRCEACQGDGLIKVEMHFLPDTYITCEVCNGTRYTRETLEIRYKGKNIHDILMMTVEEALEFFDAIPVIKRKLQTLMDVGLSYITLGQSATTLSGGEAQRIKLAKELSKRDTGQTLYILDEPTTGLHFYDIEQLLGVLHRLKEHGNTLVVIEHNLDVIKTADWILDLGPEGGSGGGHIIAQGTPEEVAQEPASYTGHYLKPHLAKNNPNFKNS